MTYALIWLHVITGDVNSYTLNTFSDLAECQSEKEKASVLVTHQTMRLECIEIEV